MGRNLVICCDGTNCQFGPQNTNVVRLVQVLLRDATRQRLFYDPGVGTLPEQNLLTAFGKWLSKVWELAFGADLLDKVGNAYRFLLDMWEPGDRVFLFGFSRGAYTARVIAALLHTVGLLPRANDNLIPYVLRLFRASRSRPEPAPNDDSNYWKLCNQFRDTFARPARGRPDDDRRFPVHFIGVWDTVSSIGWVWNPKSFPYTRCNPSVAVVRHAVSIDERRCFYRQNLFTPAAGQDFKEHWFAGVHSDVGGGYPEADGGLWRESFMWMVDEAVAAGLLVDPKRHHQVLTRTEPSSAPWDDKEHESLEGAWWLAEFFPKLHWNYAMKKRELALGLGRRRFILKNSMIHRSALRRIRETEYAPLNLPQSFLNDIGNPNKWPVLPDALPLPCDGPQPRIELFRNIATS